MRTPLAVLIDAENISSALFEPLREKVDALGQAIVWQLHGQLLASHHPTWLEVAQFNGLDVRHQFHSGKNSSDIAMTIAAMDLLAAGKVRGFCIVSSDRDFAPLARRLRADNVPVYGFGIEKAGADFRKACTEFHILRSPLALEHGSDTAKDVQNDVTTLRNLLHSACREKGADGKVPATVAGIYVRSQARELVEHLLGKKDFVKKLVKLGLVKTHLVGGKTLISVQFDKLAVVKHGSVRR